MRALLLVCAVAAFCSSGVFCVEWDNLRVKFGVNLLSSSNFVAMPRTETEAVAEGMTLDTTCSAANGFLGRRYLSSDGDRSIMLLFDSQGTIAGIQTGIPKSTGFPTADHKAAHDVYTETPTEHLLTAYFVDPAIICNAGRPNSALSTQGTGDRLVMQVGRPSSNSDVQVTNIPRTEADLQSQTLWSKGKCFIMMGTHYWYNMRQNMACHEFFPAFLLYNGGKLDGFGFAMPVNFEGKHYEHPTVSAADRFFPFVPTCMRDPNFEQTMTTVHIYFYQRPWTQLCLWR